MIGNFESASDSLAQFIFLNRKFYLYIGITSLCLYHSAVSHDFQDGIVHKIVLANLFKTQISFSQSPFSLTA